MARSLALAIPPAWIVCLCILFPVEFQASQSAMTWKWASHRASLFIQHAPIHTAALSASFAEWICLYKKHFWRGGRTGIVSVLPGCQGVRLHSSNRMFPYWAISFPLPFCAWEATYNLFPKYKIVFCMCLVADLSSLVMLNVTVLNIMKYVLEWQILWRFVF